MYNHFVIVGHFAGKVVIFCRYVANITCIFLKIY